MSETLARLGITQAELDEAVNTALNHNLRLLNDKMWQDKFLSTTSVSIEFVDGDVGVLAARSRQEAPNIKPYGQSSTVRTFRIPHFPFETFIDATTIQDVRKFGTESALLSNAEVIKDVIEQHKQYHDHTAERLRLGAIKGKIIDADGVSVIYDAYKEFGISEASKALETGKDQDLGIQIEKFVNQLKKQANGLASGVTVLCSSDFFYKLVEHKSAKEAWQRYQDNVFARENTNGKFAWKGAVFEIYEHRINNQDAIEAGHAHAYVNSNAGLFKSYYAPANQIDQANKLAKKIYISTQETAHKRGISIYTESNVLPVCINPKTLLHLTIS